MNHFRERTIFRLFQTSVRLGLTTILLCSGHMLLPAYGQIRPETDVKANSAIDHQEMNKTRLRNKNQLFVNSNMGVDDLTAGQDINAPYKTISYALSQAEPNSIIQVQSGLYTPETGETFPLVVPPSVTLLGSKFDQGSNIIVMGGGRFASSWWGTQDVTILAKSNSQIIGLTVTNPNSRGTGIWIESSNVAVRECTLAKNAREGVFTAGEANPIIENSLFVDNSANGIALTSQSSGIVRNNRFKNTGFGIAISENASPQIVNNRIQGNIDGIVVTHSATPQLRGNIIESNRRDGLVLISQASPDLGNAKGTGRNLFRNNGRHAIYNATTSRRSVLNVEENNIDDSMKLTANDSVNSPRDENPNDPTDLQVLPPNKVAPSKVTEVQEVIRISDSPETSDSQVDQQEVFYADEPKQEQSSEASSVSAPPNAPNAPKVVFDMEDLKHELTKAPRIQYKGKTYVLMDNVIRLTK